MIREDKELLIKDLCARLPYGVKVVVPELERGTIYEVIGIDRNTISVKKDNGSVFLVPNVIDIFPYLCPLSSMTEEELAEYEKANDLDTLDSSETLRENMKAKARVRISKWYHGTDWLNAHHFDYRGLIPKGLALQATEKMYNLK